MMPTSRSTTPPLTIPAQAATSWEGSIGVWPVSTRKELKDVAIARTTTNRPTRRAIRVRSATGPSVFGLPSLAAATLMGSAPSAHYAHGVRQSNTRDQFVTSTAVARSGPPANHPDVEVADFLAQRIAVQSEELRGLDLIASGRPKRDADQRCLDLPQHAVIQPRRRQAIAVLAEIARQMALQCGADIVGLGRPFGADLRTWSELGLDDRRRDPLLGIERGQAANEIFQLAHVSRP